MSLIPGLPDELAMECLIRAPRKCHQAMRAVSCAWRRLLKSEEFYEQRKAKQLTERWSYFGCEIRRDGLLYPVLVAYDFSRHSTLGDSPCCMGSWAIPFESLYAIQKACGDRAPGDVFFSSCFISLGTTVYVIGDWKGHVLAYDTVHCSWKACAPVPARGLRICAAVDGRILSRLLYKGCSIDIYEPTDNTWRSVKDEDPPANEHTFTLFKGLAFDGKFFGEVVSQSEDSAVVRCFDPKSGSWSVANPPLELLFMGPSSIVGLDSICMIRGERPLQSPRVLMYCKARNSWRKLCNWPTCPRTSNLELFAEGGAVYVLEKGGGAGYTAVVEGKGGEGSADDSHHLVRGEFGSIPALNNVEGSRVVHMSICGTVAL